jgi:hypothetical protein
VLTITDRYFFTSLHEGWLRHGLAEIIKMAITKDYKLFGLRQKAGPKLILTKFGPVNMNDSHEDEEFDKLCDLVIGGALDSYVKSEYSSLWETHQCRPHAFGHTWSPGYEVASDMLHPCRGTSCSVTDCPSSYTCSCTWTLTQGTTVTGNYYCVASYSQTASSSDDSNNGLWALFALFALPLVGIAGLLLMKMAAKAAAVPPVLAKEKEAVYPQYPTVENYTVQQ